MTSYFGTDGIRGRAGDTLTAELALRAARGFAGTLAGQGRGRRPSVVLGRDPRLSSPMLAAALQSGLLAAGCDVLDLGIVPTPLVPFTLLQRRAQGGVMITASHNPVPDNGIKFFGTDGYKIDTATERKIEQAIDSSPVGAPAEFGAGSTYDAGASYLGFLRKVVRSSSKDVSLHIVLDCAYGATAELAPKAFAEAGFEVDTINARFDGSRINVDCGATHLATLGHRVIRTKADFGLAFDGDGDRVLAVDHTGTPVSGDKIIALLASKLPKYRKQGAVVMTHMTNLGVEEALRHAGIRMVRTEVGDIQVLAAMQREGLDLGGEQSGHVIMRDIATSGDGILTGLRLSDIVRRARKPLAELVGQYQEYPQQLTNLSLRDKEAWRRDKPLAKQLAGIVKSYPDVRFYLRPSGTENLMRVLTESRDAQRCSAGNAAACQALREWNDG